MTNSDERDEKHARNRRERYEQVKTWAEYVRTHPDEDWGEPPRDERRTRLDAIASEGASFRYTYDFGDGWDHLIEVKRETPLPPGENAPLLLAGKRRCSPPGGRRQPQRV